MRHSDGLGASRHQVQLWVSTISDDIPVAFVPYVFLRIISSWYSRMGLQYAYICTCLQYQARYTSEGTVRKCLSDRLFRAYAEKGESGYSLLHAPQPSFINSSNESNES